MATLTSGLCKYYSGIKQHDSYLFATIHDGLQEVDVGAVHLGQVSHTVLCQEGVEFLLALTPLHELVYVDLL